MIVIVHTPSATPTGNNKGSSSNLFDYLSKEDDKKGYFDKTHFFNHDQEKITKGEAEKDIDANKGRLGKDEYKFYMLTINPSQKELNHILPVGKKGVEELSKKELVDYEKKLVDYSRDVMDNYAAAFNKGLKGEDIKYYGKIEHERKNVYTDEAVKNGTAKKGELKIGRQSHIHIVVSRYDQSTTKKLSPLSKNRALENNTKLGKSTTSQGFNHLEFRKQNEKVFDKEFSYSRGKKETITAAMNRKELLQVVDKGQMVYDDAKQLSRNPLSPTQKAGINEEMYKQDTVQLFSSELKKQNPISQFLAQEEANLKKAINYANS